MTKSKFDEIMAITKMFVVGPRTVIPEGVTDKVPLFNSLSAATRAKLLESMSHMSFNPGAYICRQVRIKLNNFILLSVLCFFI